MRNRILLILACACAAFIPFLDGPGRKPGAAGGSVAAASPAWPTHWEGRALRPMSLTPEETRFADGFPGALARFTDGSAEILFRRVDSPTRKLHPSADCLRALGYAVKPRPAVSTPDGRTWSCNLAMRNGETLLVREVVVTGNGDGEPRGAAIGGAGTRGAATGKAATRDSWTDISSWYWHALWGNTQGPWTAVTLSRRVSEGIP